MNIYSFINQYFIRENVTIDESEGEYDEYRLEKIFDTDVLNDVKDFKSFNDIWFDYIQAHQAGILFISTVTNPKI